MDRQFYRKKAHLIVTTRFPRDSAQPYASEPDFEEWGHRLEIFGLDLRHTPSVEAFCHEMLATRERLDFIVNNACQTVRRPPDFYAHMMEGETASIHSMPEHVRKLVGSYEGLRGYHLLPESEAAMVAQETLATRLSEEAGLTHSAELSQVALLPGELKAQKALFPEGKLDQDLQQTDLRDRNSWRLLLAEVPTVELLEVQLVNAVAKLKIEQMAAPSEFQSGAFMHGPVGKNQDPASKIDDFAAKINAGCGHLGHYRLLQILLYRHHGRPEH